MKRGAPLSNDKISSGSLGHLREPVFRGGPDFGGMLVTRLQLIVFRETSVKMVIYDHKIWPLPALRAIPVEIPCVRDVYWEVGTDPSQTRDSPFVPRLNLLVVGWFVEKFYAHAVRNR